jgi:cold shock CspA family protein
MSTYKGKVKFFDPRRQFGFIVPDGAGPDNRDANIFFGRHSLPYAVGGIDADAIVEYELTQDNRGRTVAKTVRLSGK